MIFPLRQKKVTRNAAGHIKAGLGSATDYVANYEPLFAPCDGNIETWQGEQGGNWLRVVRPNGDKIEFAHLDKYSKIAGPCKEGELIAITGNTGKVTTGPHLHVQVFAWVNGLGSRVDPEAYFKDAKPIEYELEEVVKVKSDVRQDNAFSLLVLADDELSHDEVMGLMLETQKCIYRDSKSLVLVPQVSYHKLPVWDNGVVEKIAKENFDLKTFQGVAVIYKQGKFRESLGQMNPNYKDLGFLINVSYEDPDGIGPYTTATVLEHELLHGFLYLLGKEYTESVHKSPNEFTDDFEQIGRTLEKLYYRRDPEPKKVQDSGKIMAEVKKWYESSTGSGRLALTIKGVFVAIVPVTVIFAKYFGVDLSADELNNVGAAIVSVVELGGTLISGILIVYGLSRKVANKLKK